MEEYQKISLESLLIESFENFFNGISGRISKESLDESLKPITEEFWKQFS